MSPTKTNKPESPKNPETSNPTSATPPATPTPEASTKTNDYAPPESPAAKGNGKPGKSKTPVREGTRIISVAIPERLARQVKLLCGVTGQTAQALVESALQRAVNKQLASALDSIRPDVEG